MFTGRRGSLGGLGELAGKRTLLKVRRLLGRHIMTPPDVDSFEQSIPPPPPQSLAGDAHFLGKSFLRKEAGGPCGCAGLICHV